MAAKKTLVICESPNKTETIKRILGPGYTVMASYGHITAIGDGGPYWNTGIHPDDGFSIDYKVPSDPNPRLDKRKRVKELKKAVDEADKVLLATDPDREGEAISWHLKEQLGIPDDKYERITFHEVTKAAITKALENPRKIDEQLVQAAKARAAADKICGYRLSPIAMNHIGARSVGRCQSPALKLVVDREMEIREFVPETYYDVYLDFSKHGHPFRAKYIGTSEADVKRVKTKEECQKIADDCLGHDYVVSSIDTKKQNEGSKPPFTTSTFQQEANRVYGMSIDRAMSCAQKLFEGISVNGEHVALITYIRTDDTSMSPEFADTLGKFIKMNYGPEYCAPVKKAPKKEGAQEGHECLRVINLSMKPEDLAKILQDRDLVKIYRLIWVRTVQSSMAPAIVSDTQYTISNDGKHRFAMHSREVLFDGYRRVSKDRPEEEQEEAQDGGIDETFAVGEVLADAELKSDEKQTTPPKRYTEGTLTKELDKRGIGRPSTFATIVKTILSDSRGYCRLEGKFICPTDLGVNVSKFLDKSFSNVISLTYTSQMEKHLDSIANGTETYLHFMKSFYDDLESAAEHVEADEPKCPKCGGTLIVRKGKYGTFYGCSNWRPDGSGCGYMAPIKWNSTKKSGNWKSKSGHK